MEKIAVYSLVGKVWYDSFEEIVGTLRDGPLSFASAGTGERKSTLWAYIGGIVRYNVRFRDILRREGPDGLINYLCVEAPDFAAEEEAIARLRKNVEDYGMPAEYDIQCLSIHDGFTVLGHHFNGLQNVQDAVDTLHCRKLSTTEANNPNLPDGIHVLCDYEPYPKFDSYDWGDDRIYGNYFFLPRPFTESDIAAIDAVRHRGNFCAAGEELPFVDRMPLLYYVGDGGTMLLVTPKERRH